MHLHSLVMTRSDGGVGRIEGIVLVTDGKVVGGTVTLSFVSHKRSSVRGIGRVVLVVLATVVARRYC